MLHLLIDTNAFREWNWTKSEAVKALARLSHTKKISIHIPEIVNQEYLTAHKKKISKLLGDLRSSFNH